MLYGNTSVLSASAGWNSESGWNFGANAGCGVNVSAGVQVGTFGANINANYDYNYKSGHSSFGADASVGIMAGGISVASLNAGWNNYNKTLA